MLWTRAARPSTGRTQKSPFHIAVGSSPRRIGPFSSLRNTRETFMIFIPVLRLIKRRFYSKLLYKYFYIFLSWKSLQINQFIFLCPTKFFERDSIQSVISHVFSQALTSKSLNHHRVANSSRVVATQCDIDIFLSTDLGKIDIYQRHFRVNYYYCQHYLFFPRVRCEMDLLCDSCAPCRRCSWGTAAATSAGRALNEISRIFSQYLDKCFLLIDTKNLLYWHNAEQAFKHGEFT